MTRNISDWERFVSVAAGAALLYAGSRRPRLRGIAATTGLGLIARGMSGYCPVSDALGRGEHGSNTRTALGGARGIHVYETITIARPPAELFRFWRNFANLPRFMRHLESVEVLSPTRSRWTAKAPAGTRVRWDAQVINEIENELIGWQSTDNADVASAGSVRFSPDAHGGTAIIVHLQYEPPGGRLGGWVAAAFGEDPATQIRDDLSQLKTLLEGSSIVPPAVGHPPTQQAASAGVH